MRLVVLNECFLSEDNLAYLRSVGELNVFTDTNDEETAIARLKGKDIALSDMYECPLNSRVLQQADCLKLLCLNTTGYDRVDLEAAALRNVRIANAPGASTESVAEHTFALLLSLSRHLPEIQLAMKQRPFTIRPSERAHYNYLGFDLLGKIIGIIGVGAIGAHVANIARGFGMHVLGYTPTNKGTPGVESVSLNELCARSDVITLHLPLNKQSRFLIDTHIIAKMKRGVVVINTARGAGRSP